MKKMNKKILSLSLAAVLAFVPMAAYAEPVNETEESVEVFAETETSEIAESEAIETEALDIVETEAAVPETEAPEIIETEAAAPETEIDVPETDDVTLAGTGLSSTGIVAVSTDAELGLYTLQVKDVVDTHGVGAEKVAIYAYDQSLGQDAKVAYTATCAGTDWTATIDLGRHGYKAGTYEVYAAAKDENGVVTKVATYSFTATAPKVNIVDTVFNANQTKAVITVKNAKLVKGTKKLIAAVYGKSNGDKDKKEYSFEKVDSKTFKCTVDITAHKESGVYAVYVNQVLSTGKKRLTDSKFTVDPARGDLSVTLRDEAKGYYTMKLKNITGPAAVKAVDFKVWSVNNGKDDLRTYKATKKDGYWTAKVDLTYHNAEAGKYEIYAYATDARGVRGKAANITETFVRPTAEPVAKAVVNEKTGKVQITVSNIIGADPSTVKAHVWGETNGTNDIRKYKMSTTNRRTYTYTVDLVKHLEKGKFNVKIYAAVGGTNKCRATTTFKTSYVAANHVTITQVDKNNGNFKINILNPSGLSNMTQVNVCVWSVQNGQDDAKWYPMTKGANNIWSVVIPTSDHFYDRGTYSCHIYGVNPVDNMCIAKKNYDVQFDGKIGFVTEGKNTYYYQSLGVKATGLLKVKGSYYYFDPKKDNAMTIGWAYVNGYKYYFDKEGHMVQDMFDTLGIQSNYFLQINKACNCATLYTWDAETQSYCIPVKSYRVSTGDDTPLGTYTLKTSFRWMSMFNGTWGQYTVQVSGPYFLHSVTYERMDNHTLLTIGYNMLGINKSAGCIRFRTGDAYVLWQLRNAGKLTACNIYNAYDCGPFEWPVYAPIPENQRWDPTDPAL